MLKSAKQSDEGFTNIIIQIGVGVVKNGEQLGKAETTE